jgi:hypothetical protein
LFDANLHGFLGLGLLTLDLLVLDGVEVDLAHAVHHVLVLEGDEAEAAVALGLLVHQHDGLIHLAELGEVGLDLVGGGLLKGEQRIRARFSKQNSVFLETNFFYLVSSRFNSWILLLYMWVLV